MENVSASLCLRTAAARRQTEGAKGVRKMPTKLAWAVIVMFALSAPAHAQGLGKALSSIFGGHSKSGNQNDPNKAQNQGAAAAGQLNSAAEQERLLANFKAALKLTPLQEVSWQAYEADVRTLMADQARNPPTTPASAQTAVQKVSQKVEAARGRLTAIEKIYNSAARLYEDLSDDQKAVADRLLETTIPPLYPATVAANDGG